MTATLYMYNHLGLILHTCISVIGHALRLGPSAVQNQGIISIYMIDGKND